MTSDTQAQRDDPRPWTEKDPAWAQLRVAPLDAGDDVAIAERARATEAELDEYRRFLRLAQLFPGEVCPPPRLAQIWALHDGSEGLAALNAPYDISAGQGDIPHCAPRYAKTRRAYAQYFGSAPPEEIWPGLPQMQESSPRRSGVAAAILLAVVAVLLDGVSPVFRVLLFAIAAALVARSAYLAFR
ncbi:MAG: hypothetical protein AAFQ36_14170 [Pseudomonadota bacterium]